MSNEKTYLISFSDTVLLDNIGQKAKNISLLGQYGFLIPKTYCLSTEAYDLFIAENNLHAIISQVIKDEDLSALEKSRTIQEKIRVATTPAVIIEQISQENIFDQPNFTWAVRSSSNLEDMDNASFAGVYESYLNVEGKDAIIASIKVCWASLWSAQAIVYREKYGLADDQALMAVIIQEMIPAKFAGVAFSEDPVAKEKNFILIEYCSGIAEELVSGKITPSQCRFDKEKLALIEHRNAEQKAMGDTILKKLANDIIAIEKKFSRPQDVEWAVDEKGRIYFLQTRPIAPTANIHSEEKAGDFWTRANVGEVLPGPVTPLTWDVFRATLFNKPGLVFEPELIDRENMDGFKLINGRVYIRLKQFFDSFCYLPWVTPDVMNRVLGVDTHDLAASYKKPKGFGVRLVQGQFMLEVFNLIGGVSSQIKKMTPLDAIDREDIEELIKWNSNCFYIHLKVTAYAIAVFGMLEYFLKQYLPEKAEELLPRILIGNGNLQTAQQGIALWELSCFVKKHEKLKAELIKNQASGVLLKNIKEIDKGSDFLLKLDGFLKNNGARAAEEFELAVPRWQEDPEFILKIIKSFLSEDSERDVNDEMRQRRKSADMAVSEIIGELPFIQKKIFKHLISAYNDFSTKRENVKYRLISGYALIRAFSLDQAEILLQGNIIKQKEDVFFLRPAELMPIRKKERSEEYLNLIKKRKEKYEKFKKQNAPDLVTSDGIAFRTSQKDELQGIGCSPGIVQGSARIILDPEQAEQLLDNEILVAPHTDPGWTPLFLRSKAVVTEIGGFLSHGATVAREYGIPAVVNVKDATLRIKNGDLIQVDGTHGKVLICEDISNKGVPL